MNKVNGLNVIEIQLEEMIRGCMSQLQERLLDKDFAIDGYVEMMKSFENGTLLRQAFKDGYTFCLVPKEMEKIEKFNESKEYFIIMVKDGDKIFTVIPDEDVCY